MLKNIRYVAFISLILILLTALGSIGAFEFSTDSFEKAYTYENLIRLHVVSNSNSEQDQQCKYEAKDLIIDYIHDLLEKKDTERAVRDQIVKDKEDLIEELENMLNEKGKPLSVDLSLGNYHFPEREYNGTVFPEGYYDAMRVIIGEGRGENWWCVLFPPLCFLDFAQNRDPSIRLREEFEKSRQDDSGSENRLPIKVRFKLFERINFQFAWSRINPWSEK